MMKRRSTRIAKRKRRPTRLILPKEKIEELGEA